MTVFQTFLSTLSPSSVPLLFVLYIFYALLVSSLTSSVYVVLSTGIGPVLGLLFIPLIGSASDHCNSSYGRRRPFIWLLSLGVLLALFIIPHADVLAARLAWGGRTLQVGYLFIYLRNTQDKKLTCITCLKCNFP